MRFNEFKLTEAARADFYTVGDSHARGVGTALGLPDSHNLAVNGAAAHGRGKGKEMIANISRIPQGANVLISVGANDTADVVKQNLDSQGKTPLPPTSKIVGDVMKIVNAVNDRKPNKVVFMLFPSGDNKKTRFYAGDYQKEVREALRGAVGVKVIDYDGSPLQNDGIHYQFGVYKRAGTDARKEFGVTAPVGNPEARPPVEKTKDKPTDSQTTSQTTSPAAQSAEQTRSTTTPASDQSNKPNLDDPRVAGMFKGNTPKGSEKDITVDLSARPGKKYYDPKGVKSEPDLTFRDRDNTTATTTPPAAATQSRTDKNTPPATKPIVLSPLAQDARTSGKVGGVLNLIASAESAGHYNIVARRSRGQNKFIKGLEQATIAAVYKFQTALKKSNDNWSDAVGRYQYIGSTLKEVVGLMGLDPMTTVFSPETQDRIAIFDMRRRCDLDDWLNGKISDRVFLDKLARVWAGLPVSSTGRSYYPRDKAQITVATALGTLKQLREQK